MHINPRVYDVVTLEWASALVARHRIELPRSTMKQLFPSATEMTVVNNEWDSIMIPGARLAYPSSDCETE
jgi:hypothetical protein